MPVLSLLRWRKMANKWSHSRRAVWSVVLNQTPFYAESGGQQGDSGSLTSAGGSFQVSVTKKYGAHWSRGKLGMGELTIGDTVNARVEGPRRRATALNHSATHLLHAALHCAG